VETFGRYQLVRRLAVGGMAELYLARQVGPEGFEKQLVVKRILPQLAGNQDFVAMFLDEARIAARLAHPNVVQVFDFGEAQGSPYLVMEYLQGEDLRKIWRQAQALRLPIPQALTCRIASEVCAGLDHAHKQTDPSGRPLGIIHRDVSPQNILVSYDGAVKLVDFGIAKAADTAVVTRSGVLKGKYAYMSPEQAAGRPLDHRTDVFALGVVVYELLTGARLFKRDSDRATLAAVAACEVEPPSAREPRVPADLSALVMRALERDPTQRYQEARAFGEALEGWLHAHHLPAASTHLTAYLRHLFPEPLAIAPTPTAPPPPPTAPVLTGTATGAWPVRGLALAAALGALLALGLALAAWRL